MAMNNYDVIYIDDETSMTDIFNQYVKWKYSHWRSLSFNDSLELHNKIVTHDISAHIWIVDIMMPRKNGTEIARAIQDESDPGTVVLGYTALDHHTLENRPEYRDGLSCFTRIMNKQEDFGSLLELVDVMLKKAA